MSGDTHPGQDARTDPNSVLVSSIPYRGENRQTDPGWGAALIFACLVIGLFGSMLELERSRFKAAREHAMKMVTAVELSEAREETLGKYLADSRTLSVSLSATLESGVKSGTLAVNVPLRWGALFCEDLPPLSSDRAYEIWAIDANQAATRIASVEPVAGQSIYTFHWESEVAGIARVEITAGARGGGVAPVLHGTIQ